MNKYRIIAVRKGRGVITSARGGSECDRKVEELKRRGIRESDIMVLEEI